MELSLLAVASSHQPKKDVIMSLNVENLRELKIISDDRLNYRDFEVTALNYKEGQSLSYGCENDHTGAEPALLIDGSSYNPNDGRFDMGGIIVYVCPRCKKPVYGDDDDA